MKDLNINVLHDCQHSTSDFQKRVQVKDKFVYMKLDLKGFNQIF